jgi:hypothetical protein
MEDVKNVYRRATAEGNEGQAREASQYLEKLTAEIQEIREHFSRDGGGKDDQHREIRQDRDHGNEHGERMEHLHAAMEHLHAGGFGDLAEIIKREFDQKHRQDDSPSHERDDRQGTSRDELKHVVRELGQQLEHLGRELEHVRRRLEESNR